MGNKSGKVVGKSKRWKKKNINLFAKETPWKPLPSIRVFNINKNIQSDNLVLKLFNLKNNAYLNEAYDKSDINLNEYMRIVTDPSGLITKINN